MIIFNESLYYFRHPLKIMQGYENCLKPGGIFVVSMCDYLGHSEIQKRIEAKYKCMEHISVTNTDNQKWNISVYRNGEL